MDKKELLLAKYMFADASIVKCDKCGELINLARGIHMCELYREARSFYVELPRVIFGVGVVILIIMLSTLWVN